MEKEGEGFGAAGREGREGGEWGWVAMAEGTGRKKQGGRKGGQEREIEE